MLRSNKMYLLFGLMAVVCSCGTGTQRSYAIRDFDVPMQRNLYHIVSNGIVGYDTITSYVQKHATDEELLRLSKSEHPILRAVAYREMLNRPSFDHFKIIMDHLSDTSMVEVDLGEWGTDFKSIADDIVENGQWKDSAAKMKTIEKLIIDHNYLSAAYWALRYIEPEEKYYASIKKMAASPRHYHQFYYIRDGDYGFRDKFEETEYALTALARYRKPGDIAFIKGTLADNDWEMTSESFNLMQNFPNESYMDLLEEYFKRVFYTKICRDRSIYTTSDFIKCIASYDNERSAKIIESIFTRRPLMPCAADTNSIRMDLAYAISNTKSKAFANLRKQVAPLIRDYEKLMISFDNPDSVISPRDTKSEPIRW